MCRLAVVYLETDATRFGPMDHVVANHREHLSQVRRWE